MFSTLRIFILLALLVAGCASPAPPAGSASSERSVAAGTLRVDGDAGARELSVETLRGLGAVEVTWTHRDKTRTFTAVPLEAVLRFLGVEAGEMAADSKPADKRPAWKFAVVATASDDFQATFSVAEVFREMGRTEAYVAFAEGSQPLNDGSGPLRLVVPTDAEGSRCVRNLERLTIVDLRRIVPAR